MLSAQGVSETRSKANITILDGGLGTTLEQIFQQEVSHKPLWSAKVIVDNPDVLVQAHLSFLRAKAKIISTATYQCSYREVERAGYNRDSAQKLTRKAVELADEARTMYEKEMQETSSGIHSEPPVIGRHEERIGIALSLGPFGASLRPTQDWDAFYPPPYGPMAYNSSNASLNRNAFRKDEEAASEESVRALAEFHRERLTMFLDDEEGRKVWEKVDCIAFETVALVREINAIRIAVGQAFEGREHLLKPWWITSIFPDGIFPEGKTGMSYEDSLTVKDVVRAMLGELETPQGEQAPTPQGVGLNCTSIEHVPHLLSEFEHEVTRGDFLRSRLLWLVVYPNAGDVYDLASQKWVEEEESASKYKMDRWAQSLVDIVEKSSITRVWERIIVGGCCRTNSNHIGRLHELLRTSQLD
ncbi:hypothetical protein E1B28_000219 [Marasmius oreades]|uniref:Hcy-binding domain-containing protein n=1 Tax=Marasmius oreades TaxID=181124 RepID=A0A9P7V107_9AGAR|nr:uncharacterized protein E1B28_000219 [Marasmius oreades]KAG7098257.1 hypothetical protein E1B28_000219 [Marasmius oreades]